MTQPTTKPRVAEFSSTPKMTDFHIAGFRPLPDFDAVGARDMAEQAAALIQVIAAGWENEHDTHDNLSSLNPRIHVEALYAVRTLVALSAYCAAQVDA